MIRSFSMPLFGVLVFTMMGALMPQAVYAQPQMERFKGEVTSVSQSHLIVSGTKVMLLDILNEERDEYSTDIRDIMGKPVQFVDIVVGKWIEVVGEIVSDGSVRADIIYILPHELMFD
ncbi:MAG TPA: hypothetical protein ENN05_05160 [Deltaproteobacteria bacterium]|nr:hypothetical protein [Deltaproteobacteria bacterium]